jgi:hypothetical protein
MILKKAKLRLIDTISAPVLASNVNRTNLIVTNRSLTATVSIAFGSPSVLNEGITLSPGDTYRMDSDLDTAFMTAISSEDNSLIIIHEKL